MKSAKYEFSGKFRQ